MAYGAVPKPYLDRRYDLITDGEDERRVYYAFRRRLYYDAEQVDSMPWWQRRMYLDGIKAEIEAENRMLGGGKASVAQSESNARFEAMGVTVVRQ